MNFRPCIDIHNGSVKQIVGSSLKDEGDFAKENFVSNMDAATYAKMYKEDGIKGAHVIMLNSAESEYREATEKAALAALDAYKGGLQIGGGITADNAKKFLDAGASHVIVTGYAFADGCIKYENILNLVDAVGKEHIVLDLSARKKDGKYYVVTNRWQTFTQEEVTPAVLNHLSQFCDEFLIHGVDVEGKSSGVDEDLLYILSSAVQQYNVTVTYAGGISSYDDVRNIIEMANGRLNFTVGSALDLFGGKLKYNDLKKF